MSMYRLRLEFLVLVISIGMLVAAPSKGQPQQTQQQGPAEMNDFMTDFIRGCEQRTRKMEQDLQQREAAVQRKGGSVESKVGSAANKASGAVADHLSEASAVIERIHQLEKQAPPPTACPAQKEAYAQALSQALGVGSMVVRSLDRDMGVGPAAVVERIVDQERDALSTFGKGSPSSIVGFDGSAPRTSHWEVLHVGGSQPFGGTPPVTVTEYTPITVDEAKRMDDHYGSIPQGVVLEGAATGLGEIRRVRYDQAFNALVLDDRAAYFAKVPPWTLALLCKAIADDDRVGVSIGRDLISYGRVSKESALAQGLLLTDKFLADIVFAEHDWSVGYKFKDGFVPQERTSDGSSIAVSFNFNRFQFQIRKEVVLLTQSGFDIKLLPVSKTPAPDGGGQPDFEAIQRGRTFPEYETNAKHVAEGIAYYRRERIVERAFSYGETAAFIRGLKAAHADLGKLAKDIVRPD
jgi:hypothetical protein